MRLFMWAWYISTWRLFSLRFEGWFCMVWREQAYCDGVYFLVQGKRVTLRPPSLVRGTNRLCMIPIIISR